MALLRIPLIGSPSNRYNSSTKDQKFINCIPERIPTGDGQDVKYFLNKRNGQTLVRTNSAGASSEARGIFSWKGSVYEVFGTDLYKNGTSIKTMGTSTGRVGFVAATGATEYLVVVDGVAGYAVNAAGAVTTIVDPDFPTPHIPTPSYMDGYVVLIKSTTNEIYNSDLENPLSWNSLNFITAEIFPDGLKALGRQNNQLVAFGEKTVEFFYDAANGTGSPFARTDQLVQQHGMYSTNSLDVTEGLMAWLATSEAGEKYVVVMDGFQPKRISTPAIERLLQRQTTIATTNGNFSRNQGELCYSLDLDSTTIVFNFTSQLWTEWQSNGGVFLGKYATEHLGQVYWQFRSGGTIAATDNAAYNDAGTAFNVVVQTNKLDLGNGNRKFCSKEEFIGDQLDASSTLTIQHIDDDYTTTSAARTFPTTYRKALYRNGMFRRRAYVLTFSGNYPFRAEAIELDIQQGMM